jgi:hypothetical protein
VQKLAWKLEGCCCCCCCSCRWGEIMSLNLDHQCAYCPFPRWDTSMKNRGGMILTGENRKTRIKPVPVALCQPQIPHGLNWSWTRVSASRGRRLPDCAMERPNLKVNYSHSKSLSWTLSWFVWTQCKNSHCVYLSDTHSSFGRIW